MTESTTSPTIHPDQLACRGCINFSELDGAMECMNLISFDGGVPNAPPCFEFHLSFLDALKSHNTNLHQCGAGSPEQRQALVFLMEVSPPVLIELVGRVFTNPYLINAINQSTRRAA